jgi:hypothetical protein
MKLNVVLTPQEVRAIVEEALKKQFAGKVVADVTVSNRGATAVVQDKEVETKKE